MANVSFYNQTDAFEQCLLHALSYIKRHNEPGLSYKSVKLWLIKVQLN